MEDGRRERMPGVLRAAFVANVAFCVLWLLGLIMLAVAWVGWFSASADVQDGPGEAIYAAALFFLTLLVAAVMLCDLLFTYIWGRQLFARSARFRPVYTAHTALRTLACCFGLVFLVGEIVSAARLAALRAADVGWAVALLALAGLSVASVVYIFRAPQVDAWLTGGHADEAADDAPDETEGAQDTPPPAGTGQPAEEATGAPQRQAGDADPN